MRSLVRGIAAGLISLTIAIPAVTHAGATASSRLAWFSRGKLLIGVGGKTTTVAPRSGSVFQPLFSRDGRWLAFTWQAPTVSPYVPAGPNSLWLAQGNGNAAHRVALPAPLAGYTWSPLSDQLVVASAGGATLQLDPASGASKQLVPGKWGLPIWSPDGHTMAFAVRSRHLDPSLRLVLRGSISVQTVPGLTRPDDAILAGWWGPHALLFWLYPDSNSLAADGMQLIDFNLQTGTTRNLGVMLGYSDWLAVSGRQLLIVKGGDRSAFYGKHLQLCTLGSGCRSLPGATKGQISLDPAWSPDGQQMAFVVARAWKTMGYISPARYRSWLDSFVLWTANCDGSDAHPLPGVPHGVADPQWTPDGRGLLFERGGSLWLVPHAGASNGHPIARLTTTVVPNSTRPAFQSWYYGHMNWHDLFALT